MDAVEEAETGVPAKRGMVLPFEPLAIAFHNLNYYVDMPAVSICAALDSFESVLVDVTFA